MGVQELQEARAARIAAQRRQSRAPRPSRVPTRSRDGKDAPATALAEGAPTDLSCNVSVRSLAQYRRCRAKGETGGKTVANTGKTQGKHKCNKDRHEGKFSRKRPTKQLV